MLFKRGFLEDILRILWSFFEPKPVGGQLNSAFLITKYPKMADDVLNQLSHFAPTNFKIAHFPTFVRLASLREVLEWSTLVMF